MRNNAGASIPVLHSEGWCAYLGNIGMRFLTQYTDTPVAQFQTTATSCMTLPTDTKQKKKAITQDKVLAEIKSSATLSLGRTEHSKFSGCLENRSISLKEQLCDNPDLHDNPAIDNHPGLDRDFVAILIFCFSYIEYGED